MAKARIFKPAKTAMQSGRRNTAKWVLEFEPAERRVNDPLVGWVGSGDTLAQVRLKFDTREAAVAFAEKEGLAYEVEEPQVHRLVPNNYSDNFAASKWN
ncbi:MAG: ETC complex I subunit [Rhodospirillaceae bacterium]